MDRLTLIVEPDGVGEPVRLPDGATAARVLARRTEQPAEPTRPRLLRVDELPD